MTDSLGVVLRNPDFRKLLFAQLVMFGGDWFCLVPLLSLLPELTGSAAWAGLVLATDTGVHAVLLPLAGTIADRFDRKRIMLIANLVSVGAVLALLAVRSPGTAWLAYPAIAVLAGGKACYAPAASAAVPNVVDRQDLPAATAIAGSAWGTMLMVGASIGGIVCVLVGPYPCFLIDAGCMAIAGLLVWRVRRATQMGTLGPARGSRGWIEALRYVVRRPRISVLVGVKSGVALGNGVVAVFPVLATAVYGAGSLGVGLLFAARGLGALLGPLLLRPLLLRRNWLFPGIALSMVIYGGGYLAVAAVPWLLIALPLVVLAHLGSGANWAMSTLVLQDQVPDALRGRVLATDLMLATIALTISQVAAAALSGPLGPQLVLVGCGLATVVYAAGWRAVAHRISRSASCEESSRYLS